MRYRTRLGEERLNGFRFRLARLESFESAVDDLHATLVARGTAEALEDLYPYFGVLWPSATVLARWILSRPEDVFRGRRALELGCGLGLPSFALAARGAAVTASDVHPDVPSFLELNTALNPGYSIAYSRVDWRAVPSPSGGRLDWIVASDVLYEAPDVAPLARFLAGALAPDGEAAILDPDRSHWRTLVSRCREEGLAAEIESLPRESESDPSHPLLLRFRRARLAGNRKMV